jgi:hypothetical protein
MQPAAAAIAVPDPYGSRYRSLVEDSSGSMRDAEPIPPGDARRSAMTGSSRRQNASGDQSFNAARSASLRRTLNACGDLIRCT